MRSTVSAMCSASHCAFPGLLHADASNPVKTSQSSHQYIFSHLYTLYTTRHHRSTHIFNTCYTHTAVCIQYIQMHAQSCNPHLWWSVARSTSRVVSVELSQNRVACLHLCHIQGRVKVRELWRRKQKLIKLDI